MFRKLFILMVPTLAGVFLTLQAETVASQPTEHQLIHKIIKNHKFCVRSFEGDKIFINPENIISTENGLALNLNGTEFSPLPLLQFNKRGHFLQGSFLEAMETAKKEDSKGPCPECGVNTSQYGICKNNQCFFYGLRVL